jgi:hypothetical protein
VMEVGFELGDGFSLSLRERRGKPPCLESENGERTNVANCKTCSPHGFTEPDEEVCMLQMKALTAEVKMEWRTSR